MLEDVDHHDCVVPLRDLVGHEVVGRSLDVLMRSEPLLEDSKGTVQAAPSPERPADDRALRRITSTRADLENLAPEVRRTDFLQPAQVVVGRRVLLETAHDLGVGFVERWQINGSAADGHGSLVRQPRGRRHPRKRTRG